MSKGGSSSQKFYPTTTAARLDPQQEQAFRSFLGEAQNQYAQGPMEFYPGSTIAPESQQTIAARQLVSGATPRLLGQAAQAGDAFSNLASPAGYSVDPRLAEAVSRPVMQQFQEQILPSIRSSAVSQGAFGGTRQGLVEGQAARDATGAISDSIAQAALAGRSQDIQSRLGALGSLGSLQQGYLTPIGALSGAGAQEQAYQQALVDADRQRFEFNQQAPGYALDQLLSRITGVNLGGITATKQGADQQYFNYSQPPSVFAGGSSGGGNTRYLGNYRVF